MAITTQNTATATWILDIFERDEQAEWLRGDANISVDEPLKKWVEVALTQIALLVGDDEVVFAEAARDSHDQSARLIVFTRSAVVVTIVDDEAAKRITPLTTIVPRSSIQSMTIGGGDAIIFEPDHTENRNSVVRWPGLLSLSVEYAALDEPVLVSGNSRNLHNRDLPGPIVALLTGLRADLATGKAPAAR